MQTAKETNKATKEAILSSDDYRRVVNGIVNASQRGDFKIDIDCKFKYAMELLASKGFKVEDNYNSLSYTVSWTDGVISGKDFEPETSSGKIIKGTELSDQPVKEDD